MIILLMKYLEDKRKMLAMHLQQLLSLSMVAVFFNWHSHLTHVYLSFVGNKALLTRVMNYNFGAKEKEIID